MKNIFTVIIIAVCFGLLGGCKSPEKSKQTSFFEWTDAYGRAVHLEKEPQRIVSLSPSITEILYLIGAQDKLVGVSDFCKYPSEVEKLPKMGGMQNINMEALLSVRPDVVLIGSIVSKKDVEAIEKMHIPVVTIKEENNIAGMADMISVLGDITNCKAIAERESKSWSDKVTQLKQQSHTQSDTRKSVYYVVGFGDVGDFTAPKTSHIHEIIELAGCTNVGAPLKSWNVSREFLFEADPDIILVRSEDKDAFCSCYPYTLLSAVINNRVYAIESGWIDVVSVRNLKAVEMLRAIANQ
ncbi:MAG: ABC transporter substrate-binding protein [Bacteroidales bacterium]|nr:ABC transporter substrate-binding protein [Bacteroidales bacterium]